MLGPCDSENPAVRVAGGSVSDVSAGFDDPDGIVSTGEHPITADFPHTPSYLDDVALAPLGRSLFVTDSGAATKTRNPDGRLWPLDGADFPLDESEGHLLLPDTKAGTLVVVAAEAHREPVQKLRKPFAATTQAGRRPRDCSARHPHLRSHLDHDGITIRPRHDHP
jgi:hypothetical protein